VSGRSNISNQQITFEHLAWAAIFFGAGEPERKSYLKIVCSSGFPKRAINDPDHLTFDEVKSELVKFLQTWGGMRIPKKERVDRIAKDLVKAFIAVAPIFRQLHACRLETLELTDNLKSEIEDTYRALRMPGLGPTGVSKVLHVLNPALFVMWDAEIRQHYKKCGVITSDKPAEYVKFLDHMYGLAQDVIEDASRLGVDDPACFLSHKLNIHPSLTLAKFIDEYNYMRFTRKATIPPSWHPDKEQDIHASF